MITQTLSYFNEGRKAMNIAAYARVSTKSEEQERSYESQKRYFEEDVLCLEKYKGCELYKVYSDKDTATRFKRKGFLEMLHDAGIDIEDHRGKLSFHASNRPPLFNRIIVTNLSRFARDTAIIDPIRELTKKEVYIDFLSDNKSTENESDMMYIELMFTFAANESRDKSIKVRDGLNKTAKRGELFTNQLYGYDYIIGEKRLEINEEEAKVVKTIFELYIDGIGFRRISNYLNENGMTSRNGKQFRISALKKLISNEKYAGILVRNKWTSGVVFSKHSPKQKHSDYIFHEAIPAIISEETFNLATKIRESKVSHQTQKGIYKGRSKYANLLLCEKCGSHYVRNTEYKKSTGEVDYHFYLCGTKKVFGTSKCDTGNVRENWVDWAIEEFMNGGLVETIDSFKDEYVAELNRIEKNLADKIDQQKQDEGQILRNQLLEIEEQKKRVAKLYTLGNFSDDEIKELLREIDENYNLTFTKIKEITMSNEEIFSSINEIRKIINDVKYFQPRYDDSDMLKLIDKIIIRTINGSIDVKNDKVNYNPDIIFEFKFKMFDSLYDIVDRYLSEDDSIKKTFSSTLVLLSKLKEKYL